MGFLLFLRPKKQFHGQLFLLYLMLYAVGRFVLEYFRGDGSRGVVFEGYLSHAQFIALFILGLAAWIYVRWKK
jgi:phosphatidylglycerol:prolipoprotein diacylglycerol transferase